MYKSLREIPSYKLFLYVAFDLHAKVNYKLYFLIFFSHQHDTLTSSHPHTRCHFPLKSLSLFMLHSDSGQMCDFMMESFENSWVCYSLSLLMGPGCCRTPVPTCLGMGPTRVLDTGWRPHVLFFNEPCSSHSSETSNAMSSVMKVPFRQSILVLVLHFLRSQA